MMDGLLGALGLTKGSVLGGFVGAVVSLKFIDGLNWWQRATTVLCGMMAAAFTAPITIVMLDLKPATEGGIAFLIGLFGMSLAGAVVRAMPEIIKAVNERIAK